MMTFVQSLAAFAGLLGFCLLASRIARPFLAPGLTAFAATQQDGPVGDGPYGRAFLIAFLIWCLALAMAGSVTGVAYYIGVEIGTYVWAVGALGLVGFWAGRGEWAALRAEFRATVSAAPWTRREMLAAGSVLAFLVLYLLRAGAVWQPHDEVAVYGFLTKIIANGFTASDVIDAWRGTSHSGPKTIESLDAIFYWAVDDTYLVRILRWLNLLFVTSGMIGFLRLCGLSRTWALLGASAFLLTPDLAVIGMTLKVDGVLMAFEMAAMFCLLAGLAGAPADIARGRTFGAALAQAAAMLFFALVFGMAAVATRQSGLYIGFLSGLAFTAGLAALFLKREWPRGMSLLTLGSAVVAVGFVSYAFNIVEYGNPIFPFKAGWPFAAGEHRLTLDQYRDLYNLRGLPPLASELYLLIHAAFGVEWIMRDVAWLPHNQHDASIRWLSPVMLCVFVLPAFFRVRALYALLFGIFVYQYLLWSHGVQYTRVFMASSALMVIAAALIADDPRAGAALHRGLRAVVRAGIIACVMAFLVFHVVWLRGQGHLSTGFFGDAARDPQRLAVGLTTYGADPMMTRQDRHRFQSQFDRFAKPKIFIGSFNGRLAQVLFPRGFFMEPGDALIETLRKGEIYRGPYQCLLATSAFLNGLGARDTVGVTFGPETAASENGQWHLHCRSAD